MQPRTNPAPAGSVGITAWYAGGVASAGDTGSSPEIDGDFFGDDEGELTQAIPAVYDLRSRFTGRKEALATLERLFTAALTERTLGFAVVLGQPGMGKSRLVGEFARLARERTAEVRVLTGAAEEAGASTVAASASAPHQARGPGVGGRKVEGIAVGGDPGKTRAGTRIERKTASRVPAFSRLCHLTEGAPDSPHRAGRTVW